MSENETKKMDQSTMIGTEKHFTDTFSWRQGNTSRTFPVDYSLREFGDLIDRDFHTIGKSLVDHPLLKKELYSFIRKEDQEKAHPLPVEAKTLLSCVYDLLGNRKSKYYGKFTDNVRESSEEFAEFLHELCKNLHAAIFSPDKYNSGISHIALDDTMYTQHALFHSKIFNDELLKQLWDEEFNVRIERLRVLLDNQPPARRMQVLLQCLCYIDRYIYDLGPEGNAAVEKESTLGDDYENPLQEILACLLAQRKKMYADAEETGEYQIGNIVVPEGPTDSDSEAENNAMPLQTAFTKLQDFKHPKKALMQRTRNSYLRWLEQEIGISATEKEYLKLKSYLDYEANPKKIDTLVVTVMKRICVEKIDQCTFLVSGRSTDAAASDSEGKKSKEESQDEAETQIKEFVSWIARDQIENALQIFGDIFSIVEKYSAVSYAYEKVFHVESLVGELREDLPLRQIIEPQASTYAMVYKADVEAFFKYFQRAWDFLHSDNLKLLGEESRLNNCRYIASAFTQESVSAAKFFEKDELFRFTVEEVEQMLLLCEKVLAVQNIAPVPKLHVSNAIVALSIGVLLQTLKRVVSDQKANIVSKLQWLFAL